MGRISQILKAIRLGIVDDIPPEYQACESCRNDCCDDPEKAAVCKQRLLGEMQERKKREEERKSSG